VDESGHRANEALERLCRQYGISAAYVDAFGTQRHATPENLAALLAEFGVHADAVHEDAPASSPVPAMPPVLVVEAHAQHWSLQLPHLSGRLHWRLTDEEGRSREGDADAQPWPHSCCTLQLAEPLESGYHWLHIDGLVGRTLVVASPGRCYRPPAARDGGRVWGPAVQLYGLRSPRNWGIGDFGDLEVLIDGMAGQGADIVGLNPLHALFPTDPSRASPYSPSSRQWLNVLYIDVEAVAEFAECDAARQRVESPEFQSRLAALRAAPLVDHAGVAAAKFEVLELLFEHFLSRHLSPAGAPDERGRAFLAFISAHGEPLRRHALFEALQAHFAAADPHCWGWLAWPEAYREVDSPEVKGFEAQHASRLQYHQYLQWVADGQLARAGQRCEALGMGIGLYLDLAVSADRGGSDAWTAQHCFAVGASIGAPPDEFNPAGQNWGLPPLRPDRLRTHHYDPFVQMLRANMRHAGALRIDHVMGLMRLFWIPPGRTAHDGAYVRYPVEEMLAIVAVESHRYRCMVVGEDLGTVEDAMREALARADVLSYRLLYFEKQYDGGFTPPEAYPPAALVAISTHDLATLAGWWSGHDLRRRLALGLFPDPRLFDRQLLDRAQERIRLLLAVREAGLLSQDEAAQALAHPAPSPRTMQAVHAYLAAAPSALMVFQLEDVAGEVEQANMPGTTDSHPNWRRKLAPGVQELVAGEAMQGLAERLRAARPRPSAGAATAPQLLQARVPRATYRLQFHKGFGFDDAIRVLPYLAQLGVSHVYCSPIQRARAGSTHGYDVVAHAEVNPELGGAEGFARFVSALQAHGLGQLLDMVPNHMGVLGADNAWWMDVLENGPASLFAQHFDIDWKPLNPELAGKVLLPVLGGHYGEVLASGELVLHFEAAEGGFALRYYDHRFPLAPESYPVVLAHALPHLKDPALSAQLASLSSGFGHLPGQHAQTPVECTERVRDKELFKSRLAHLAEAHPSLARAVLAAVAELNLASHGARDELHKLIDVQAYRLAYWRVAADEINYRRFFDINDLAAVRMERDEVFEATQSFALDLAAAGVVDGLRIDHPDGLYDPARYFRQLQEGYARRAGIVLPATMDADGRPPRPLYVVAEKIAASEEEVPVEWHVHGTTGYRFANVANGVLVDTAAADALRQVWHGFTGETQDFESVARSSKREVMRTALSSELNVLSTELLRIARADRGTRDYTLNALRRALSGVAACMAVYRTYIVEAPSKQDAHFIDAATGEAERQSRDADRSIFDFVRRSLRGEAAGDASPELARRVRRFAMRFQQFSAPVAAKGVEDTSFYRYFPLSSLNEVGGEPDHFGFDVPEFHLLSADRARHWPHTMLATSTHDNKRSEDVRNRIDVLSEIPGEWRDALARWHALCRGGQQEAAAPSRADEYLLYQTLLGTLPYGGLDAAAVKPYEERVWQYMQKAAREAKLHTRWTQSDPQYEGALESLVQRILSDLSEAGCLADIQRMADRLSWFGAWNGLTLTLLKYASPGVPDLYQGSELIDLSLVDPDNRRPVDYELRTRRLDQLQSMAAGPDLPARVQALAQAPHDGAAKLWFIWRMLSLRREHAALFREGGYEGLAVEGPLARHVVAFARRYEGRVLVVMAGRLFAGIAHGAESGAPMLPNAAAWRGTRVVLPEELERAGFENALTGEALSVNGRAVSLDEAFVRMPWAALKS